MPAIGRLITLQGDSLVDVGMSEACDWFVLPECQFHLGPSVPSV